MTVREVTSCLEELAPLEYAESFDNVGLLVGEQNMTVSGILVTLDTLEEVVDEAITRQCNLIVSFHPIIFSGLKKITGSTYVERVVVKAIKHNIAIYAIHTALDNAFQGVNGIICDKLKLKNKSILIPQQNTIKKLITYVPKSHAQVLQNALFKCGAGILGNYSNCSFIAEGKGTFKGNEHSNPVLGEQGLFHEEDETQISILFQKHLESKVIKTLKNNHPYEEVAFEITTLDNKYQLLGMGMVGTLEEEMETVSFLKMLKQTMNTPCIKYSQITKSKIRKVAVLGGSGSFAIGAAKASGADIFITSDLKYHDYFQSENKIIIADIGHYESEQFTKCYLVEYLSKKITNFASAFPQGGIVLSNTNTNPVKYL